MTAVQLITIGNSASPCAPDPWQFIDHCASGMASMQARKGLANCKGTEHVFTLTDKTMIYFF